MKLSLRALFTVSILTVTGNSVLGQGSLIPPGPPEPGMKTLEQIEPRTPVSTLPYTISNAGSYYVTADLSGTSGQDGITIDSENVTLDLNGFTLRGVTGTGSGIVIEDNRRYAVVRNGVIRDWREHGVNAEMADRLTFSNLRITGSTETGLLSGDHTTVEDCQLAFNGMDGIWVGNEGTIRDCKVESSFDGAGIRVGSRSRVTDSTSTGNITGIVAGAASIVENCMATGNTIHGILAASGAVVRDNTCRENGVGLGGAGLLVTGDEGRIEANHLTGADYGLWITGSNNYVAGNTVLKNSVNNYVFADGNHLNLLLSEIPQIISWPASVKLAGSLTGIAGTHGITIHASSVTIDLNGFELRGVPGSMSGIRARIGSPNITGLTVRNGVIRNWGNHGIYAHDTTDGLVEYVKVITNGLSGIEVGDQWIIRHCQARGYNVSFESGIRSGDHSIVSDCVASDNYFGIKTGGESIVKNCTVVDSGYGIDPTHDSYIHHNNIDNCTIYGISVSSDSRVEQNHVTDCSGVGIKSFGASLILRNTTANNTSNYQMGSAIYGPIVSVTGDISTNTNADHPWANFDF